MRRVLLVLVALVALSIVARPAKAHDRYSSRGHWQGGSSHSRSDGYRYSRYGSRYGSGYYGSGYYGHNSCSPYGRSYYGYGYSPGFSIGVYGHNGGFHIGF